jgi:hypothetical protein
LIGASDSDEFSEEYAEKHFEKAVVFSGSA